MPSAEKDQLPVIFVNNYLLINNPGYYIINFVFK